MFKVLLYPSGCCNSLLGCKEKLSFSSLPRRSLVVVFHQDPDLADSVRFMRDVWMIRYPPLFNILD